MNAHAQAGFIDQKPVNMTRVTGMSMAMLFNITVLLVVSIPAARVLVVKPKAIESVPVFDFVHEEKVKPIKVDVKPPENIVKPTVTTQAVVEKVDTPTTDDSMTFNTPLVNALPATNAQESTAETVVAEPSGPVSVASLEYTDRPHLPYPRQALKDGIEGVVKVRVFVSTEGVVTALELAESSGNRYLDRAALKNVAKWKFKPAEINGKAVEAIGIVPINFNVAEL